MRSLIADLPAHLFSHALRFLLPKLSDLEKENLMLRYQLLALKKQVSRPRLGPGDRSVLQTFSKYFSAWKDACILVQPETVLKWHRDIGKQLWSKNPGGRPTIPRDVKETIFRIKRENRLWGPKKIHGEMLKLDFDISESSIRNILRNAPNLPTSHSQRLGWREFLRRHKTVWAMDFFTVHSATFKRLHVLVIMNIHTRQIVSVRAGDDRVTGHWVSNILRNAIADADPSNPPSLLIHDRDGKFRAAEVQTVIKSSGVRPVKTPFRAPLANCFVERLNGTLQRECTDHFLFFTSAQLERVLQEYRRYYNQHRPHQGIQQRVPCAPMRAVPHSRGKSIPSDTGPYRIRSLSFLEGLHHSYFRAAA